MLISRLVVDRSFCYLSLFAVLGKRPKYIESLDLSRATSYRASVSFTKLQSKALSNFGFSCAVKLLYSGTEQLSVSLSVNSDTSEFRYPLPFATLYRTTSLMSTVQTPLTFLAEVPHSEFSLLREVSTLQGVTFIRNCFCNLLPSRWA